MKSDFSQAVCIALTSLFFLATVVTITEGKCSGYWARHTCWGGNGKRSDPSMDAAMASPGLLMQLLSRNSEPDFSSPSLEDVEQQVSDALELPGDELGGDRRGELRGDLRGELRGDLVGLQEPSSAFSSQYPDYPLPPPPSRSVDRLTELLRTLRTLRKESDALP